MMKSKFLFPVCFLLSISLLAQDNIEINPVPNKDSAAVVVDPHIQRYPNHFFLWPVLKQRALSFDVQNLHGKNDKLTFKPNNALTFGLGVYLFDLGLEFTFAIPTNKKNDIYGTTHAKDIQINALARKFGFDLYDQKYSGYYQADSRINIPQGKPYPQRSDIVTRNFGLSGFYIVNNKKFSIRSAYNYAERQLRSRGSLLIVGALNSFKLTADSSVLPYEYRKTFTEGASFDKLKYTTFSVAPGYSYNLIYKQFFFNGTVVFGPAHNWIYYKQPDGKSKNDITINTYTSLRLSVGYNSDHFFTGISYVLQSRNVKFEEIQFTNTSSTFKFLVGYRFREFGILKKSVWDIPRKLLY